MLDAMFTQMLRQVGAYILIGLIIALAVGTLIRLGSLTFKLLFGPYRDREAEDAQMERDEKRSYPSLGVVDLEGCIGSDPSPFPHHYTSCKQRPRKLTAKRGKAIVKVRLTSHTGHKEKMRCEISAN